MGDSSKLSSQKMSFFTWEWWTAIDFSIQVSSKNMLDQTSYLYLTWFNVWKLDPVLHKVVSNPINHGISSLSSLLNQKITVIFLWLCENSTGNPVVLLTSIDPSHKSESVSSTKNGQSLDRLLDNVNIVVGETNSSPLQHLVFLGKVGNGKCFVLSQKTVIVLWDQVNDLIKQVFTFDEPLS